MLRTMPQTRDSSQLQRLAGIAFFTILTVVCSKITVPVQPVPFTMQTFAVLLAGMVLGARDGALSQIGYLLLIAINLPVDAYSKGSVALFGATGGYLVGFVVAAFVVGLLVERGAERPWQRWLAGLVGAAIIHLFGVPVLALTRGLDLGGAWALGSAPFILADILKTFLAVSLTEGSRALLNRRAK